MKVIKPNHWSDICENIETKILILRNHLLYLLINVQCFCIFYIHLSTIFSHDFVCSIELKIEHEVGQAKMIQR